MQRARPKLVLARTDRATAAPPPTRAIGPRWHPKRLPGRASAQHRCNQYRGSRDGDPDPAVMQRGQTGVISFGETFQHQGRCQYERAKAPAMPLTKRKIKRATKACVRPMPPVVIALTMSAPRSHKRCDRGRIGIAATRAPTRWPMRSAAGGRGRRSCPRSWESWHRLRPLWRGSA